MSLFEHYKSTPESIQTQHDAAVTQARDLVRVRDQVVTDHVKAASGLGGIFTAVIDAKKDPAYLNADRAAKLKLIASASLLRWVTSVNSYDTGVEGLNKRYDEAKSTSFGVDADDYYDHGTQSPEQRDAAYQHALTTAQSALVAQLTIEKNKLDATLDDGATSAKTTLNTDPSDANLTMLFQAGLFPVEATLEFSAIDTSKIDIAKLVANLKALGLLPANVDPADLQKMESLLAGLGNGTFNDAAALGGILKLMQGMDPATLKLFMALVPSDDLDKWNKAIAVGGGAANDYKLLLSNMMLKVLDPDEVRKFMSSLTVLQPGYDGVFKDATWTWLNQQLGADGANLTQIYQGQVGDCWFIASIGAELQKDPNFVKDHMHDNGNGTYTVTFYHDGKPVEVTVDGEIPTSPDGGAEGAHTGSNWSSDSATWLAIYEKAYASYKGGYHAIEGGYGDEGMSDLTGKDADREGNGASFDDIQKELESGHPVTVGTKDDSGFWWWQDDDDDRVDDGKLVSDHEYIVKEIETLSDGSKQIVLINPWGNGGSAPYEVHLNVAEYKAWINEVSTGD